MTVTAANYLFLPWVRQGAAAQIQTIEDMSAAQTGVVSVTAALRINETEPIERLVRLYGPSDVTALDLQQIIRTEPRHLSTDFEPNYFPAIEFDRPDLPWLFTPGKADGLNKLRPWLCLIVVRKQEGVTITVDPNLPVTKLEIKKPAKPVGELPDLSESWAWAHAQVTGCAPTIDELKKTLTRDPALTVSRLLCPRRLDPLTEYMACVVPTFELGRKAGLGLPFEPNEEASSLTLAWPPIPPPQGESFPEEVTLPVYFYWEFRTGLRGDFEALAKALTPRDAQEMPNVGKLQIDIGQPGAGISMPGTTVDLEGALRVFGSPVGEWAEESRGPFQEALKTIFDAAATADGEDPTVAPPVYGSWQAARHRVHITADPPATVTWLDEMNLDPRHRAAASLGTQVVQKQQEQLMAAAWEQFGDLERINQLRRQAQFARAVNSVYYTKQLSRFSEETLMKVFASAKSRVLVEVTDNNNVTTNLMLSQRISDSALPNRAVSAPIRRLSSSRSAISTRFRDATAPPVGILNELNNFIPSVPDESGDDSGMVMMTQVSELLDGGVSFIFPEVKNSLRFEKISTALESGPGLQRFKMAAEGEHGPLAGVMPEATGQSPVGLADSEDAKAFRIAAAEHHSYMVFNAFLDVSHHPPRDPLDLVEIKKALLNSVNPDNTIKARVLESLKLASGTTQTNDLLEPLMDAPEFPQPMYEALRDLSQDFLLPGLHHVLPDTVMLLEPNAKFVESFLVGLNAEMSRELLWRNYPTDQSATYFHRFWDTSSGVDDINAINKWGQSKLGENTPHTSNTLILLLRSELLRRYPNSVIYAVAADDSTGQLELSKAADAQRQPLFRGTMHPDVTFVGFDLTREQATAHPGWFFVIQQQPTEPRFGLDIADFSTPEPQPIENWNDLSWRHLSDTDTEEGLKELSHASSRKSLAAINNVEWGRNGAHQAYITLQRPVRIAIHARQMIKLS